MSYFEIGVLLSEVKDWKCFEGSEGDVNVYEVIVVGYFEVCDKKVLFEVFVSFIFYDFM